MLSLFVEVEVVHGKMIILNMRRIKELKNNARVEIA